MLKSSYTPLETPEKVLELLKVCVLTAVRKM